MKRLLFVDDDALVLKLYHDGLTQRGFAVDTASDGLSALRSLKASKPDLVVLDLMMPRLTGVDVLRSIRSEPDLASLPVVVLSNSYMDELARQAAAIGVQKALLKVSCRPSLLASIVEEVLAGKPTSEDRSHLLAIPAARQPAPPAAKISLPPLTAPPARTQKPPAPPARRSAAPSAPAPKPAPAEAPSLVDPKAQQALLEKAAGSCSALRDYYRALAKAQTNTDRAARLQSLYRQVRFVGVAADMSHSHQLAQMSAVFEAMLYEIMDKPARLTTSALRTMAAAIDFLDFLFQQARNSAPAAPLAAQVLIVDEDPLSNRLVLSALGRAQLQGRSTGNPAEALRWMQAQKYNLVLLDAELPGMNPLELRARIRALPGYERTPVVFLADHKDFAAHADRTLAGEDVISKPVFPMELAVKAVSHLLKA